MQNSKNKKEEKNLSQRSYKGHSIHDFLVAIWVRCDGDYGKMIRFLSDKTPISSEEIARLSQEQRALAEKKGAKIVTIADDDYPEECKKMENPPICYVETNGRISAFPLKSADENAIAFRYYIEFCPKGIEIDSDHDYILQSKWFSTKKEATKWYEENFDYVDSKYVSAFLMTAKYYSEDDYGIVGCDLLRNI